MRLKLLAAAAIILFYSPSIFSQSQVYPLIKKSIAGTWTIEKYDSGMIKTTFDPNDNRRSEQVSNAVLLKQENKNAANFSVETDASNTAISFLFRGKKLQLIGFFDSADHKGFRFALSDDEKILGTGERSVPVNRRGYKLGLYNNPRYGYSTNADNLNYSVPFLVSSNGYGIFFDNPSRGYLDIGKNNHSILEYGASSGKLEFYIIPGNNPDEILRRYHYLTGRQPLPARWVFGNLMSRFGYRSQEQVMNTVAAMQKEKIPVDAVILDLFWFGDSVKGTMGNLDWTNRKAWPAPGQMISKLKTAGIQTILITEPYVLKSTPNFKPSLNLHATDSAGKPFLISDFYFGEAGLLDIFKKETADWFWTKYNAQIRKGVAGWWGDLGEPERHPANLYHNLKGLGFNRLFAADEVHNIYGHYWDKMLFEKYALEYPDVRLFHLNRSGYAGSPRYGVFPWSGDVSRSWEGLQAQLPLMLGMSLSGIPYIHSDAGGFAGGDGDKDLYTRWLQLAVFTPVFRPHGTALGDLETSVMDIPSEAALYDDPYKSIVRNAINLRYKLLPYNYTLAYEQASAGKALIRPLFYYNLNDSNLFKTDNQYMWGEAFLVAPVLQKGIDTMPVYFPGGNWFDFFTDKKIAGNRWITQKLTPDRIPVFVKEGSFVPMFLCKSTIKNTLQYNGSEISIKYYPSLVKSTYTLFDDDGHSKSTLAKGNFELIQFEGQQTGNRITIKIYTGTKKILQSRKLSLELPAGFNARNAKINNVESRVQNNSLVFTYTGQPIRVEVEL